MRIEKDTFTIRLSKEATERINALRGDLPATTFIQNLLNDLIFNQINKYFDKLGNITKDIDKSSIQNTALLSRINDKVDQLLKSGQAEASTMTISDTPDLKRDINYLISKINSIDRTLNVDYNKILEDINKSLKSLIK